MTISTSVLSAIVEETGERGPALEHVVHRLGEVIAAREFGALLAQPAFQIGDQGCAELLRTSRRR